MKNSPQPSIAEIINCVEAAQILPFEAGIAKERAAFDECETGPEATAMRHAFFAERRAAKVPRIEGGDVAPCYLDRRGRGRHDGGGNCDFLSGCWVPRCAGRT